MVRFAAGRRGRSRGRWPGRHRQHRRPVGTRGRLRRRRVLWLQHAQLLHRLSCPKTRSVLGEDRFANAPRIIVPIFSL